jgi:hypothetical protein
MAKGNIRRRRKTVFVTGNTYNRCSEEPAEQSSSPPAEITQQRKIVRLTPELYDDVKSCPVGDSSLFDSKNEPMLLRPRKPRETSKTEDECSDESYRRLSHQQRFNYCK